MRQNATERTLLTLLSSLIQVFGFVLLAAILYIPSDLERERETEILEPPVTKKQRVEGPSEDEIIVLDNEQGVQSKPDKDPLIKSKLTITSKEHMCAPMFYLTKVRGLNNQYNSSDMTIGIKGNRSRDRNYIKIY